MIWRVHSRTVAADGAPLGVGQREGADLLADDWVGVSRLQLDEFLSLTHQSVSARCRALLASLHLLPLEKEKDGKTKQGESKQYLAPPRIELGSREPKSRMLPTTPWSLSW